MGPVGCWYLLKKSGYSASAQLALKSSARKSETQKEEHKKPTRVISVVWGRLVRERGSRATAKQKPPQKSTANEAEETEEG